MDSEYNYLIKKIDSNVKAAHNQSHILQYLIEILELPEEMMGCIVEAGVFPLVIDVFKDENFWLNEVGCSETPVIEGLGKKITIIRKK
jgi:hypothetical protein